MHRLYDIQQLCIYIFPKIFTFFVIKVGNKSHGVFDLFVFPLLEDSSYLLYYRGYQDFYCERCWNRSGYRLPGSRYQWATIYFRGCPWCQQFSPGPWAETATSELRSPSPGIHYLHFLVCQAICTVLHNDPAAPQKDAEFWHVFNEPRHLIIYLSVLHHLLLVSSPNAILNIWYIMANVSA